MPPRVQVVRRLRAGRAARRGGLPRRPALGLALCSVLAATSGCVGPLVERVEPSGRRLVLLLDTSTSMRRSDPDGAALLGVDLTLGLAGSRDNVAVVAYATDAEVVVPLRPAGGEAERERARAAVAEVARNGTTDFATALSRARDVLEAGGAPEGSSIVLVTDGIPFQRPRRRGLLGGVPEVDAVTDELARRGWRVFAIALGAEAATPFLTDLVARTGGSVVPAADGAGLVAAFEAVAVEALGYLRAERAREPVQVPPETRRLAVVARFAGGRGELLGPTRDGGAAPAADAPEPGAAAAGAVIRTPPRGGPVAVALVEDPAPGRWTTDAPGAAEVVALLEPRFTLDFAPGRPAAEVEVGAPIPVAARLRGDPAAVEDARARLRLRARHEPDQGAPGAWVALAGDPAEATLPGASAPGTGHVVLEATLPGPQPFVLTRKRALTVRGREGDAPPAPAAVALDLDVAPAAFEATAWADAPRPTLTFEVRGDPTRAVTVRAGDATLDLAPGARGALALRCPEDGVVRLTATAAGGETAGVAPWSRAVRGRVAWLRPRAPTTLDLGASPAGVAGAPVALDLAVEPTGAGVALAPAGLADGALTLRGPAGASVPVEVALGAPGAARLVARPAPGAAPGAYRGALALEPDRPGLPGRRVAVTLEVLPALRAPDPVVLRGAWGWVTRGVDLVWPAHEPVPVVLEATALEGPEGARIDERLDVRLAPLQGWSGEALGLEPRRVALEVYLASHLPAGTYTGRLRVRARDDPGAPPLEVPVQVEVRR